MSQHRWLSLQSYLCEFTISIQPIRHKSVITQSSSSEFTIIQWIHNHSWAFSFFLNNVLNIFLGTFTEWSHNLCWGSLDYNDTWIHVLHVLHVCRLLWKAKSTDTIYIIVMLSCWSVLLRPDNGKLSHIALCRHVIVYGCHPLERLNHRSFPEWIIYVSIHTILIVLCSYRETWGTQAVTCPHSVLHSMQAKTLTITPLNQGYISSYINMHRSLWLTAKTKVLCLRILHDILTPL